MKTVNINLIGDLGKISKINTKNATAKGSFTEGNPVIAYIVLTAILVIFASVFGGWLLVRNMTSNLDKNLMALNEKLNTLKDRETQLSNFRQDLKKENEISKFKIIVQKQLNDSFFPWSSVLKEIADKIPKNIIVQKIEKNGSAIMTDRQQDSLTLKISGIIPADKQPGGLTIISLFIFNLNQNKNSLLSNAKISKLEFNDKTKAYEFEIETSVSVKEEK